MRASKVALLAFVVLGCESTDPPPPPAPARPAPVVRPARATPARDAGGDVGNDDAGSEDAGPDDAAAADDAGDEDAAAQDPAASVPGRDSAVPTSLAAAGVARIDAAVRGAIDRGEIPGAVVLVVAGERVVFHQAYGLRAKEPAQIVMTRDTVFDLASLTKPIATATSIALLVERGRLRFSDPVARHIPAFAAHGKAAVTIEQLLLHTSGLPADNALSDYAGDRAAALAHIFSIAPKTPPGQAYLYSDLGYVVLGEVVARLSSSSLDGFVRDHLSGPLAMRDTAFSPPPRLAARAAPTEKLGEHFLLGKVHDPRARALGGVAGHAGLFSTALDLSVFSRMLLGGGALGSTRVLAESTVRTLLAPHEIPGARRAYFGNASGEAVSHTGFTGTSLWLDPGRKIAVVILSNRVHPDGKGSADRLRRETIEACVAAAQEAQKAQKARKAATTMLETGIDALASSAFAVLRGRKIALLTHAAGRDRSGRSAVDVLRAAPGVTLVSLLSPEHGLRSTADSAVADEKDPRTGLAVHSLYGSVKRPTKTMLAGADTIVIDLQDAGARFYTYETTLGYTLEAAAELGLRVVVLDRPNPTGGVRIAGPVLGAGHESFVAYHRVPVQHGMTLGELARLFNGEKKLGADLVVVPMKGWKRSALFADTGLAWTPPSPSLTSPAAALLYPGVGLVELTNVSVGRGTAKPFEQLGAPWIDGEKLAAALRESGQRGVTIAKTTFTPKTSTFAGELCHGVTLVVTAPAELDAVKLGLAVAVTLRRLYPETWRPSGLATLLGHDGAQAAIVAGKSLDEVLATFATETAAFAERRKPYLLY